MKVLLSLEYSACSITFYKMVIRDGTDWIAGFFEPICGKTPIKNEPDWILLQAESEMAHGYRAIKDIVTHFKA